jgi:hypothetical protein
VASEKKLSGGFELTLSVHGTMAFVPTPDMKRMRILLGRFPDSKIRVLTPYVRFADENWSVSNKRQVFAPPLADDRVPAENRNLRFAVLDDEFLILEANVDPAHAELSVNDSVDPFEPDEPVGATDTSLHWLPNIERIHPGFGNIESGLLEVPLRLKTSELVARIDLTQGFLETTGASKMKLKFRRQNGEQSVHAIAREAILKLRIAGDHFYLRSVSLVTGARQPDRDMRFDAGGADLAIVIGNEPEEDIFTPAPEITDQDVAAEEAIAEFGNYYRLCARRVTDPPLPHVRGRRPSGHLCANGRYLPSPDTTTA